MVLYEGFTVLVRRGMSPGYLRRRLPLFLESVIYQFFVFNLLNKKIVFKKIALGQSFHF